MDNVSSATRSRMMSSIKGKDTKPELAIRGELHRRGYRFRLHYQKLPGKPDIVLPKFRAAIFVNGCFWHGHTCHLFKWPKSREEFWRSKIEGNRSRDRANSKAISNSDWRQLTVWECAMKGKHKLPLKLVVDKIEDWIVSEIENCEISCSSPVRPDQRPPQSHKDR